MIWLIIWPTVLTAAAPISAGHLNSEGDRFRTVNPRFKGSIIDSIEIDNRNIYDLENKRYQGFLFRAANRLHIVTRQRIVRQEMLFHVGDKFDPELVAETARNLRTRFPFNDAWIETKETGPGRVLVRVVTIDQWSLIGGLRSLDREGQETDLRIGFDERNLLGRAQFFSFDIYLREKHPDYVQTVFNEPRLLGKRWAIGLTYRSDPHNTLKQFQLSRPYYSLAQRLDLFLHVQNAIVLNRFVGNDGGVLAEWMSHGDQVEMHAGLRYGPPRRKMAIFGDYKYVSLRIRDTVSYLAGFADHAFPGDSTYHFFSLGSSYQRLNFIVERRLRGFGYVEDVTLGATFGLAYGRAFLPDFRRHYYDLLRVESGWSGKLGSNLLNVGYSRFYWYKQSREFRRQSILDILWYNNRLSFLTLVMKTHYESDRGGLFQRLVLGGKSGLRGYPTEFSSGDRVHVINFEGRFFTGIELLSVKIGAALLGDVGRAWKLSEPLTIRGYHWSLGAGLRFSLENLLRGEIIRADFVRTEDGFWDILIGAGHYF